MLRLRPALADAPLRGHSRCSARQYYRAACVRPPPNMYPIEFHDPDHRADDMTQRQQELVILLHESVATIL
eukprot:6404833-Heterocapsa_arctica.AAC.1